MESNISNNEASQPVCSLSVQPEKPGISTILVRQEPKILKEYPLTKSISEQTGITTEFTEANFYPFYTPFEFTAFLRRLPNIARGKYIYIGTADCILHQDFFAKGVQEMQQNDEIDIFCSPILLIDEQKGSETILEFSLNNGYNEFRAKSSQHPGASLPTNLFCTSILRSRTLYDIISTIEQNVYKDLLEVETFLYKLLFSTSSPYYMHRSQVPLVSCTRKDPIVILESALDSLKRNDSTEAIRACREAEVRGVTANNFYQISAAASLSSGNTWEASLMIDKQLAISPNDETTLDLKAQTPRRSTICDFEYERIAGAVESIDGYLLPGQEKYLFNKAKSLPDNSIILEIGSYRGRSTAAMAFACLGTNKRIYAVDPFECSRCQQGRFAASRDIFEYNLRRHDLLKYVITLQGFSTEILHDWRGRPPIDFAFIDGSHSYAGVKNDLALVYPHVKKGGWIAFHDMRVDWCGVWQHWHECAANLLSDHEFCLSIAAGRKLADIGANIPEISSNFDFCSHITNTFKRNFPDHSNLWDAMLTTNKSTNRIELETAAQLLISNFPSELKDLVARIASFVPNKGDGYSYPAIESGTLYFWHALSCIADNKQPEYRETCDKLIHLSMYTNNQRISLLISVLKGLSPAWRDSAHTAL